jgi:thiamine-phosphate pyrophosphorylase
MPQKLSLILLTTPEKLMSECDTLDQLLALDGIDFLHIRKETDEEDYIRKIVNRIPKPNRSQLVLHGFQSVAAHYKLAGLHHKSNTDYIENCQTEFQTKSFHSIEEIRNCKHPYKYGFLSPVFDSISKKGYKSNFDLDELESFLKSDQKPFPIIALGGVCPENIAQCKKLGFDGVAILGAIWSEIFVHKKLEVFERIKNLL